MNENHFLTSWVLLTSMIGILTLTPPVYVKRYTPRIVSLVNLAPLAIFVVHWDGVYSLFHVELIEEDSKAQ